MTASPPSAPKSAYEIKEKRNPYESHTFAILVDNEPGVLARVVGLFSGRGYNIDGLTVSETGDAGKGEPVSRITVVANGTPRMMDQIRKQLQSLVCVREVGDLTHVGNYVEAEMAVLRIKPNTAQDAEMVQDIITQYDATIISQVKDTTIIRVAKTPAEITQCIEALYPLGRLEIGRSGVVAMWREFDIVDDR